ncbi:uncharacterized protein LOC122849821 [Aphidius gifuensis]|uniref:uncharacterized protein LOC122849821 n=1 Tax=Aphidius gifuensis TaxID=684658 RepID=UPI001CDD4A51|nr:uncharacterized protein LOC122849821 [Aphidius gifuensis]
MKSNFLIFTCYFITISLIFVTRINAAEEGIQLQAEIGQQLAVKITGPPGNLPIVGCLIINIKNPAIKHTYFYKSTDNNGEREISINGTEDLDHHGNNNSCSFIIKNFTDKFIGEWIIETQYKENFDYSGLFKYKEDYITIKI